MPRFRFPFQPFEVGAHFRRYLVAQLAVFLQRLINDVFEFGWKVRVQPEYRKRLAIQNFVRDHARAFSAERQRAGSHLIQNCSEGEKIASSVQLFRTHLLRRHVSDRAEVRMVQGRRRAGFPAEAFQRLRILREALRQKLQGDKAAQLGVFRLVDDTHATATELLDDAVVRNGLADHWRGILRISSWQVNESQRVGGKSKGWLAQNRVSDNVGGVKQFSSTLQNALKRRAPFRSS